MAALPMRFWWLALALILWTPEARCKEFTNDDLRDTLLALLRLVRTTEQKMDRNLQQIKKASKEKMEILGRISRLDERLSNVETLLLNKETREKITHTETIAAMSGIKNSILNLTSSVQDMKRSKDLFENNLTAYDDTVERRLNVTDSKIQDVKNTIENISKNFNLTSIRTMCLEAASSSNPFEKHVLAAETLLTKYEQKLSQYNGTKAPADSTELTAGKERHNIVLEAMTRQGSEITKIQKLLSEAESVWKALPTLADLQTGTNQTLDAIVNATEKVNNVNEAIEVKMKKEIRDLSERLQKTNVDIQLSLTEGNTLAERTFSNLTAGYQGLRTDVQSLMKSEKVMLRTADNVIANKRSIEYSVHQIVTQINTLMTKLSGNVNSSLSHKLDSLEAAITGNQALTHVNLGSKIETETSKVWRQIGIMHEQLRNSHDVLNKLTALSEGYTNSSTIIIEKVKLDVDSISKRMDGLTENLNYALGRLGLVTEEFRRLSNGIEDVMMTGLKKDAATTTKPAGPGPHPIPGAATTP